MIDWPSHFAALVIRLCRQHAHVFALREDLYLGLNEQQIFDALDEVFADDCANDHMHLVRLHKDTPVVAALVCIDDSARAVEFKLRYSDHLINS